MEVELSYEKSERVANDVLETLSESEVSFEYGLVGCGLAAARLYNFDQELTQAQEIAFIQAFAEWQDQYWFTVFPISEVH